jgi:hypothetical protein
MVGRSKTCVCKRIRVVPNTVRFRSYTYTPSVTNRPTNDTPRISTSPHFEREDLRWVNPRHSEPSRYQDILSVDQTLGLYQELTSEDRRVQEHKESRSATDSALVLLCGVHRRSSQTTGGEHANPLSDGSPVESPSSSDAVECEDADQSRELPARSLELRRGIEQRVFTI